MAMRQLLLVVALLAAACAGTAGETTATTADVGTTTAPSASTPTTTTTGATTTTTSAATTTTGTPASTVPPAPTTVDVSIENFKFTPGTTTVRVGDTVRWTVTSGTHTTTSNTAAWDSKSLATSSAFTFTFTEAGTYPYFCAIHPGMQATITVEG